MALPPSIPVYHYDQYKEILHSDARNDEETFRQTFRRLNLDPNGYYVGQTTTRNGSLIDAFSGIMAYIHNYQTSGYQPDFPRDRIFRFQWLLNLGLDLTDEKIFDSLDPSILIPDVCQAVLANYPDTHLHSKNYLSLLQMILNPHSPGSYNERIDCIDMILQSNQVGEIHPYYLKQFMKSVIDVLDQDATSCIIRVISHFPKGQLDDTYQCFKRLIKDSELDSYTEQIARAFVHRGATSPSTPLEIFVHEEQERWDCVTNYAKRRGVPSEILGIIKDYLAGGR